MTNDNSTKLKKIWYILKSNLNYDYGPFTQDEVNQFIKNKTVNQNDFICSSYMNFWIPISEYSEVFDSKVISEKLKKLTKPKIFNRRRNPRLDYKQEFLVVTNTSVYEAESVDISPEGIKVKIPKAKFGKGLVVTLKCQVSNVLPTFEAQCKVVNIQENIYGLVFLKVGHTIVNQIRSKIPKIA